MDEKTEHAQILDEATPARYVTVNLHKAIGVITAAILAAFISGVASALYTINSDHFKLVSLDGKVAAIDSTYVRQDVLNAQYSTLQAQLSAHITQMTSIEKSIDLINTKLDKLR